MRDNRYTNMWGEDLEEQRKRREWLSQIYDNAITSEPEIQTPIPEANNDSFVETSHKGDISSN